MKIGDPDFRSATEIIIARELLGSPMEGKSKVFIEAGRKYNVDPLFLLSIQFHESKLCSVYSEETNNRRHNCAGIMAFDNGKRYIKEYQSYDDFIMNHARIIRTVYFDNGKQTLMDIWSTYAPLSEKANVGWGYAVGKKYNSLRSELYI